MRDDGTTYWQLSELDELDEPEPGDTAWTRSAADGRRTSDAHHPQELRAIMETVHRLRERNVLD